MTASPQCHVHPEHPAVAICCSCSCDICLACHGIDPTGMARGLKCCADEETRAAQDRENGFLAWERASPRQLPGAFVQTAVSLLSRLTPEMRLKEGRVEVIPTIPFQGKALRPALFGLICLFIGTTASTLWRWIFVGDRHGNISRIAEMLQMEPGSAMALSLVTQQTMLPLFFLVHVGALWMSLRLVGVREPTSEILPKAFHVAGYAAAAHLFQIIPPIVIEADVFPLDHFLVVLWLMSLELTAIRAHFGLRYWAAFTATFGPVMVSVVLFVAR